MSVAPEDFLPYIHTALDGMLKIVEDLGDERINQRPANMDNTSSPYVILTHCVALTHYWLGAVIAGRTVHRDREAEFRAQGTVADMQQAVHNLKQHIDNDIKQVRGDQPAANPSLIRQPHMRDWTQGRFLLQCYKELSQHFGHMELTRDVMLGHGPAS